jgi:hypothetical protein
MKLEVKLEELRKQKIFIATPCYGGMAHGLYMKSGLDLQALMGRHGIETRFSFLFNESLITRARNYLVDEFLDRCPDFTHLLFIDADIHYDPQDVLSLLALSLDPERGVIGGPYPKKSINWNNVAHAARNKPDLSPGELETVTGDFVFNPIAGTKQFQVTEPLEVMEIGTGFMMVRRDVFPKFAEAYPQQRYKPDHVGQKHFDGSRYITAYFDTVIDHGKSDRYLSEDYMFCQWWRNIGGKIWLCPWMKTQHIGTYPFNGNLPKIAELTGRI